jgi:V/A-type H+-transporting ATPase subunit A
LISSRKGSIASIHGSLISIKGIEKQVKLHNIVKVEKHNILGEVLQIYPDYVIAQCFENTEKLRIHEDVLDLGSPLSMELAPGLISSIFDGIQRPLKVIYEQTGGFLERGIEVEPLSRTKKWLFKPTRKVGDIVEEGDVIGVVKETPLIEHKIMVPFSYSGTITQIVQEGEYTIIEDIYTIKRESDMTSFPMLQKWPVTKARPFKRKNVPNEPLITGIRVIDLLFPIARGGCVAVPGGFGTGKTVIQQSLAKWCNADIIILVGCGERGNEMADVLKDFLKIIDPKTNRPLIERVVLIANTSNMPVSAREISIFSGVTIAEYYRDMGYNVAVLADSTSRWAEALREISGLMEEMPAEEGYPAYLSSKLSSFYERSGVVQLVGSEEKYGSITLVGSVSPPSGDFSEPVTATTKRFVQAFWALDAKLAYSKHYPAINWLDSYSKYTDYVTDWWFERNFNWKEIDVDWMECRTKIDEILAKEANLENISQLIGEENLPEEQQLSLFLANLIKKGFLIQNAFDEIDRFTDPKKLLGMIKIILLFFKQASELLQSGVLLEDIKNLDVINTILRIGITIPNEDFDKIVEIKDTLIREMEDLKLSYRGL